MLTAKALLSEAPAQSAPAMTMTLASDKNHDIVSQMESLLLSLLLMTTDNLDTTKDHRHIMTEDTMGHNHGIRPHIEADLKAATDTNKLTDPFQETDDTHRQTEMEDKTDDNHKTDATDATRHETDVTTHETDAMTPEAETIADHDTDVT